MFKGDKQCIVIVKWSSFGYLFDAFLSYTYFVKVLTEVREIAHSLHPLSPLLNGLLYKEKKYDCEYWIESYYCYTAAAVVAVMADNRNSNSIVW